MNEGTSISEKGEKMMTSIESIFQLVGPHRSIQVFGIRLLGFNADNGRKLIFSVAFVLLVWLLGRGLKLIAGRHVGRKNKERRAFWTRQAISITVTLVGIIGLLSIWFGDPTLLKTAVGLVTAGLAFTLQRVVTAIAGYLVILRGKHLTLAIASPWVVFAAT